MIDFKPLEDKEHEGLYGGKAFADGACKIGGLDKICFTLVTYLRDVADVYSTVSASPLTTLQSMM